MDSGVVETRGHGVRRAEEGICVTGYFGDEACCLEDDPAELTKAYYRDAQHDECSDEDEDEGDGEDVGDEEELEADGLLTEGIPASAGSLKKLAREDLGATVAKVLTKEEAKEEEDKSAFGRPEFAKENGNKRKGAPTGVRFHVSAETCLGEQRASPAFAAIMVAIGAVLAFAATYAVQGIVYCWYSDNLSEVSDYKKKDDHIATLNLPLLHVPRPRNRADPRRDRAQPRGLHGLVSGDPLDPATGKFAATLRRACDHRGTCGPFAARPAWSPC